MEPNVSIVKLASAANWDSWKFQIRVTLRAKGLYDIVVGEENKPQVGENDYEGKLKEWKLKDYKAQDIIVSRLDESPLSLILTCNTAEEIWSKLLTVYEKKSDVSIHLLQQRFFNLSYSGEGISGFLSKVEEVVSKIKQLDESKAISDSMIITKILMALPSSYSHFVSAWDSVPVENQTLNTLNARLLIEEERMNASSSQKELNNPDAALKAKSFKKCFGCGKSGHVKSECFRGTQGSHTKNDFRCHYCNKLGHIKKKCFEFKKSFSNEIRDKNKTRNFVSSAFVIDSYEPHNWFLDTGATEHLCCNKGLFTSLRNLSEEKYIRFGDNKVLHATGIGDIDLKSRIGPKENDWVPVTLYNVLFVPGMNINLFSVGSALDKGHTMRTSGKVAEILNNEGNVIAVANRDNRLYTLNFEKREAFSGLGQDETSLNIWHQRMAHQNVRQVKDILHSCNEKYSKDDEFFCEACALGKQTRRSFKESDSKATKIGQLIHADLCGPMEENSIGGSKYFLLLKDDFSHYRFVYFLKYKSEVTEKLKLFLAEIRNQTRENIKVLRTDCGTEFLNIERLLSDLGIIHEKSVPYCPEQNGRIEREMRTVVEAARTMIASKNLKKDLWAEAVNTAVYVLNRTGTSTVKGKTPYHVWFNKEYDVKQLKVFGTEVFVQIPKVKRNKWDYKSKKGIFVGYGEHTKGYRIYFPDQRKVEINCNVIFKPNSLNEVEQYKPVYKRSFENEDEESTLENNLQNNEEHQEEDIENNPEEVENSEEMKPKINLRNRNELRRPVKFNDYETELMCISGLDEPQNVNEAMQSNDVDKWKNAMNQELKTLVENNTWTEIKRPQGVQTIDTKWVFKKKKNDKGESEVFKARLVAKGFQQKDDFDFSEIYSPVAKLTTMRILMSVANQLSLPVYQMDVTGAFLYGEIDEDIYLSLPPGFVSKEEDTVLKLNKSIYGLKKSPKKWNEKFTSVVEKEGFLRSQTDSCLYSKMNKSSKLYILIYVDDLLIMGTDESEVEQLKRTLNNNFAMKDLGYVSNYLGIKIDHNIQTGETKFNQTMYLKEVLKKFGMEDCKPVSTPMNPKFSISLKNTREENKVLETRCRRLIGCLMYAMLGTRPDISFAISYLSRFQSHPSQELWTALKRILRYMKGTIDLSLVYKKSEKPTLQGFVDSDWAGDINERKSTTGYLFKLGNNTISWSSKKQSTVSLSTAEAEYIALSSAVTEGCWIKNFLKESNLLPISDNPVVMFEDNQSTIRISSSEENKRLKHVDVKYYFVKEKVKEGTIQLQYISTEDQQADLLTKPLPCPSFEKFRCSIGLK